ncbi:alpha/beta fold hydrolase [Paenibacillus radicis (ex Xue et al. 2023)]|uniref:Alpha/beta fold hydrolase n=1 Tax=Paenibacillus radicis (ex Xue et al. 2023) TaxID=2972489 RepID=A0ABT1Y9U0_9BACL|nr:alpha/beta fold hydrolase [Paenibacillus radicis (ex Xue et al. 2023)]MCR8629964.1 alpha/beta fold hydrolase [Paenibacillus radicis (ex Xue et al. 2023)]
MLKKMNINGVTLYVEDQGEGPAIITLHGGPGLGSRHGDAAVYGTFASEGYRAISYDQRGNGQSEGAEPYSHEQFNADTEALRTELGLGKIIIAGGSYGGYLALEYALRYPENVAGIVLRDTAASNAYRYTAHERAMKSGLPGITQELLDRLFNGQAKDNDDFRSMYAAILPLYWVKFTQADLDNHLNSIIFRYETHNWAFSHNQPNFNIVDRLKTIQAPTLVLCGRHDWITPLEASEEIAREIPNSRLVVFENSGHSPQNEEREKFQAEVRRFLNEVVPTSK